jgi:hypothetical protein
MKGFIAEVSRKCLLSGGWFGREIPAGLSQTFVERYQWPFGTVFLRHFPHIP